MSIQEIPQHVIRFYGNIEYAIECIALKQITFIHLDKLNDPFDPALGFATDFNDNYASLLAHVQKHYSKQLVLFTERLTEKKWNEVVASWTRLAHKMRSNLFVFSACEVGEGNHPRDSLYMWGHYGNGHRGVAIEFNTAALTEALTAQADSDRKNCWWELKYKKELPRITCESIVEFVINAQPNADNLESFGSKLLSVMDQQLHSKGEIWKPEDEWRLVWENDETKLKIHRHDVSSNAISAVYLGCRAAELEQVRNDFIYETQRHFPDAGVFRASMRRGEYALNFERIA